MIERHCFSLILHCCCASSILAWSSLSVVKAIGLVFSYPSNTDNERVLSWAWSRRNWQNRPQEGKEKCFIGHVVQLVEQQCCFLKVVGSFLAVGRVFCSPCVGWCLWLGLVIWLLGNVPFSFYLLMVFPRNITHSEELYLILSYLRTTIQDICLHRQEIVNIITAQFAEKERSHSSKCHDQTNPTRPVLLRTLSFYNNSWQPKIPSSLEPRTMNSALVRSGSTSCPEVQ